MFLLLYKYYIDKLDFQLTKWIKYNLEEYYKYFKSLFLYKQKSKAPKNISIHQISANRSCRFFFGGGAIKSQIIEISRK